MAMSQNYAIARAAGVRMPPSSRPQTNANLRGAEHQHRTLRDVTDQQMASGLGWFSVGLGLAEIFAPQALGQLIGAGSASRYLPLLGLREVASGVGILRGKRPAAGLISRVAGDVMNLMFLAAAANSRNADPARLSAAAVAIAGVTALDVIASERVSERPKAGQSECDSEDHSGVRVYQAITINRTADDLYKAWRDFPKLADWMRHLKSVEPAGEGRWHWVAEGPAGFSATWDAEITADEPGKQIAWRSLEGSSVATSGSVIFAAAPGGRGTELRVQMTYDPPGGHLGAVVASLFGRSAEQEIGEDLRRFKSIMETGEAPCTTGQPTGRCAWLS